MPRIQLKEPAAEKQTEGGDMYEKSASDIDFTSGARIEGESREFPSNLVVAASGQLKSPDVYLPPERSDEVPLSQADPYEYESAGGAEFPRERLESDFAARVVQRRADAREAGVLGRLSLTDPDDENTPTDDASRQPDEPRKSR